MHVDVPASWRARSKNTTVRHFVPLCKRVWHGTVSMQFPIQVHSYIYMYRWTNFVRINSFPIIFLCALCVYKAPIYTGNSTYIYIYIFGCTRIREGKEFVMCDSVLGTSWWWEMERRAHQLDSEHRCECIVERITANNRSSRPFYNYRLAYAL